MNQSERIQYLAERVLKQQADQAELDELAVILENETGEAGLYLEQLITAQIPADRIPLSEADIREMSAQIVTMDHVEEAPVLEMLRTPFLRKWWWAAASVLVIAAIATYFWFGSFTTTEPVLATNTQPIEAGRSGAILTLDNGVHVQLDSVPNGVIATQNGTEAVIRDGQLAYQSTGGNSGTVAYNTMSTPNGREFRLVLPDGTQVWLNAASSIRYPTVFAGKERKVEITGEAYFEVAKKAGMPFIVSANKKAEILVLGTIFNVNAYENETSLNTTLIEGAVKVNGAIIKPAQQAQVMNTGSFRILSDIDTDKVMAWKNGFFNFEGASIGDIMRQVARWYDIEVVYEKQPHVEFEGKMTKDVSLQGLMVLLEKSGIHLRLEGRKLIVLP